jgi:hypothetical protein
MSGLASPDPPAPSGESSPPPNRGPGTWSPTAAPPDADGPGEPELGGDEAVGTEAPVGEGAGAVVDGGSGVGRGVGRGVAGTPDTLTGSVEVSPRTHRASGSLFEMRTSSHQRPACETLTLRPGTTEGLPSAGTWTVLDPSVTLTSQLSPDAAMHESA